MDNDVGEIGAGIMEEGRLEYDKNDFDEGAKLVAKIFEKEKDDYESFF